MRWSYVVPRVVIVTAVWWFFTFGFDPLLRRGAVSSSQLVFGAKVDVEDLETGFFPPSISLGKTAVANRFRPGRNLFEFDSLQLRLESDPLLNGVLVIKNAELHGLRCDTDRADSGKVALTAGDIERRKAVDELRKQFQQLGKQWLNAAVDGLKQTFDPKNLNTIRTALVIDGEWRTRFEDLTARVKRLEVRVKGLETLFKNFKTQRDVLQQVNGAARLVTETDQILLEFQSIRNDLQQLGPIVQRDFTRLDAARRDDFEKAKTIGTLLSFDAQKISETLLGQEAAQQLTKTMSWVREIRRQVDAAQQKKPKDKRFRGEDIEFARPNPQPWFVVENLVVSGELSIDGDPITVTGRVQGLTSDAGLYGKPTEIHLESDGREKLNVDLIIDQSQPQTKQHLCIRFEPLESKRLQLGEEGGQRLTVSAEQSVWSVDLHFHGDQINGVVAFNHNDVVLTYDEPADSRAPVQLARILQNTLDAITSIQLNVQVSGRVDSPELKLDSNLGDQISRALNAALVQEIDVYRQQFAQQVDAVAVERIRELQNGLKQEYAVLLDLVKLNEDQLNAWKAQLPAAQLPNQLLNRFLKRN
ncbi:MAG: TIGR03545 family protein [Planctomycetota bacterium]|nr:TIGR03545 family protein [Planctomycetota bacterium]